VGATYSMSRYSPPSPDKGELMVDTYIREYEAYDRDVGRGL